MEVWTTKILCLVHSTSISASGRCANVENGLIVSIAGIDPSIWRSHDNVEQLPVLDAEACAAICRRHNEASKLLGC